MTGLSSILQPLSSDLSRRKPPDADTHPTTTITTTAGQPRRLQSRTYSSSDSAAHVVAQPHASAPQRHSAQYAPPITTTYSEATSSPASPPSKNNRFSIAAIARDKTNTALANLSLRPKTSTTSLHSSSSSSSSIAKQAQGLALDKSTTREDLVNTTSPDAYTIAEKRSGPSLNVNGTRPTGEKPRPNLPSRGSVSSLSQDRQRILDRSFSPSRGLASPPEQGNINKMHQTSSRLLRMTDEERPFTRDFEDLFSTLMVSLPLGSHRVRFQKVEHTFTSEEAINNLGSLKFSQSNRMPDPKDPSRIVTTTTTTTFSMAKEMARSVCQRFMDARFIEPADGKPMPTFPLKNAVWQLTSKGMHVLTRFCQRNGINQRHVLDVLDSPRNTMQLVILERDGLTDKLSHDKATIEVIFRRFAGQDGPNIKLSVSNSDSDSLSDYYNGLIGVKMAKERKILDKIVPNTFTGKAAVDWLMDCCTTVDRREVYEIAELFVQHGLIWAVVQDKVYVHHNAGTARFQPTKNAIYGLQDKGLLIAGWIAPEDTNSSDDGRPLKNGVRGKENKPAPKDSNNNRLTTIVNDPALRLLFREFLRDTHCEENLAFYIEVREFTRNFDHADRAKAFTRMDAIRETLAAAYGMKPLTIYLLISTDCPRSL